MLITQPRPLSNLRTQLHKFVERYDRDAHELRALDDGVLECGEGVRAVVVGARVLKNNLLDAVAQVLASRLR